jgi:hypothetical protein
MDCGWHEFAPSAVVSGTGVEVREIAAEDTNTVIMLLRVDADAPAGVRDVVVTAGYASLPIPRVLDVREVETVAFGGAAMRVAVGIGAALVIAVWVRVLVPSRRRRRDDPVFRRSRALAALGRAADMPRVVDPTTPEPEPMLHVHLVERAPADLRRHRPRPARTCRDAGVRNRPTIAVLPALPNTGPPPTTPM